MIVFLILAAVVSIGIAVAEVIFSVRTFRGRKLKRWILLIDAAGLFLLVSMLIFSYQDIIAADADWYVQINQNQSHLPFASEHRLTLLVMALSGLVSTILLTLLPVRKLPPLLKALLLSGTYLGTLVGLLGMIQIFPLSLHNTDTTNLIIPMFESPWLVLAMLCILLIAARTTALVVRESDELYAGTETGSEKSPAESAEKLPRLRRFLKKSSSLPVLAAILLFPLTGVIAMILMLFGQAPDAAIRAFTETADWAFSTQIPPQSLFYDEHYLCTVAAGGHKKVVKPLRMGIRHGHPVVVNRQLQVANAFEQILEERTPRFHKAVRGFYDRFGFPFARLIHTKTGADIIYFVMKPLEWIFLIVLYLCDINPENRIAMQYTGKKQEDLL